MDHVDNYMNVFLKLYRGNNKAVEGKGIDNQMYSTKEYQKEGRARMVTYLETISTTVS